MSYDPVFEAFCAQVCSHVRFRPDHAAIQAELTAHLEDRRDALLAREDGLLLADASVRAVAGMGDPETLGRNLDRVHSPVLGWFQIWLRRLARAVAAAAALALLLRLGPLWTALTAPPQWGTTMQMYTEDPSAYDAVADFRPDALLRTADYVFTVERAVVIRSEGYGGRRTLSLFYTLKAANANPWLREPDFREWLYAADDLGNRYPSRGEQLLRGLPTSAGDSAGNTAAAYPFASYYDLWVTGIDPAAGEVTLIFDRFGGNEIFLTIPLRGGGDGA